jgi:hypothetical protein
LAVDRGWLGRGESNSLVGTVRHNNFCTFTCCIGRLACADALLAAPLVNIFDGLDEVAVPDDDISVRGDFEPNRMQVHVSH